MRRNLVVVLLLLVAGRTAAAATPPPRDVNITAPDGATLKGTYYASAAPGPAVLLLHMCNANRTSWEPVARQLSAVGIHALAFDYRGFGESSGERFASASPEVVQKMIQQQPGDVDAALAWLSAQAGVDRTRIGAGGGSCGVTQAALAASRHPEIRSLVLLAGDTDREGLAYLRRSSWLPVFVAAAADDQFDPNAPASMRWLSEVAGNPRNKDSPADRADERFKAAIRQSAEQKIQKLTAASPQ